MAIDKAIFFASFFVFVPSTLMVINFEDNTGSIDLIFFKRISWIKKYLKKSVTYIVFGKPNFFNGKFSIVHPEIELHEKTHVPQ